MKKFNELVADIGFNVCLNELDKGTLKDNDEANGKVANLVNILFKELIDIFPMAEIKWKDDGLARAKKLWVKTFMQEDISTLSQIKHGILKCRSSGKDFPPNVGQFVQMCVPSPKDLGIPDIEKAYTEAVRNHGITNMEPIWTHKAVYHAAKMTNFSNRIYTDPFKQFEKNYMHICKRLSQGVELEEIPKQLSRKIYARTDKDTWTKNMSALKQMVI